MRKRKEAIPNRGPKSPKLPAEPTIRTMDLYGCAHDGRRVLWQRAAKVMPVSEFENSGIYIHSGHFVIDHQGRAIVVHCGNFSDGAISLRFVHGDLTSHRFQRSEVEPLLLGKEVKDPGQEACTLQAIKELLITLQAKRGRDKGAS